MKRVPMPLLARKRLSIIKRALGEPLPQRPQVPLNDVDEERRDLGGLLFEELPELNVLLEPEAYLLEEPDLAPAFSVGGRHIRHTPHQVDQARTQAFVGSETFEHRLLRERELVDVDHMIVELGPFVVFQLDVHPAVDRQEVEREGDQAILTLVVEVLRRALPVGREHVKRGIGAGSELDELFRQLERLGSGVAVEAEDEVGLQEGNVAHDHVDLLGDQLDLRHSPGVSGLGLVAHVVPRLDARQARLEPLPVPLLTVRKWNGKGIRRS